MKTTPVTFEDVRKFTVSELWPLKHGEYESSCLAHDFRIAGEDGKEFMEAFSIRFKVSLAGFHWEQYFGPEAANPLGLARYFYMRLIKGKAARELTDLPELSLGHLVNCANAGKWIEPCLSNGISSRIV